MLKGPYCALRLSVLEKLVLLTFLASAEFVKAWLEAIKCMHNYPLFPWSTKIIFSLHSACVTLQSQYRIWQLSQPLEHNVQQKDEMWRSDQLWFPIIPTAGWNEQNRSNAIHSCGFAGWWILGIWLDWKTILTWAGGLYMDITLCFLVVPEWEISTRDTGQRMDDILPHLSHLDHKVSVLRCWWPA